MVNMTKKTPDSTSQAQWKVVFDRLDKLEIGDVVPYKELQALLPTTEWKGVVAAFHQARKRFTGIDFENVRGEGYQKVKVAGKPKQRERVLVKESVPVEPVRTPRTNGKATKAPAVAFVAADTGEQKPTKLTDRQRIDALEAQVEFLTNKIGELGRPTKAASRGTVATSRGRRG